MEHNLVVNAKQVKALRNAKVKSEDGQRVLAKRIAYAKREAEIMRSMAIKCSNPAIAEHYIEIADEIEYSIR